VFVVMALWELGLPRRELTVGRLGRWPGNLGIVAIDTVVVRVLFPTAAVGVALVSVVFFGPLSAAAGGSVDKVTPAVRTQLSGAGVPAARIAALTSGLRACAVDRASAQDPTVVPVACRSVATAAQDPAVGRILATQGRQATGESFAHTFQIALGAVIASTLVAFALMFGLPRRLRPVEPATVH